ncbi:adenylate/guanylate cyclase domain-containing protein [Mycobacterium sp. EPa45]|uniref:adenylate/guanylate cyclase domain-containing protein n=1 Tax=Mycobacterium sp. EPa45 TaxID=1545728 RepID=UPI000641FAFE|nr:adenylate/guanylate cyclase domain-containing protein [Mycobacterium sp. EPa45]AKK29500.1 hypothetical protein AB431_25665 [Mycobacterium sp. EPa45]
MKVWPGREFAVNPGTRTALAIGALVPSMLGASVIGVMASRGLPTGAALSDPTVLRANVIAAALYAMVAVPIGCACGLLAVTVPTVATTAVRHSALVRTPIRLTSINAVVWTAASVLLVAVNIERPWLAATLGISTLLGSIVTATLTYWWCTRVLRPFVAPVLTTHPPTRPRRPGLRMRAVAAWAVGTGVPLLMVLLVAVSALVVDYPGDRLAAVVLALGGAAVVSGFTITVFTAATNAEPIEAVRKGMDRIGRGDYDARVPVFDASELGLLQAGFNSMAGGLRERERLRDIFGRQVGRDVARLAEQSESDPVMGGVSCDVAVVFVDVIGSTRLASDVGPQEFVGRLNEFFVVAVDVVERHRGWVNKFLGDAILAVFGAPEATPDPAGDALAAARQLAAALGAGSQHLSAGIGVSAGVVVAGNVGDPRRYEYTVMGDPVNEAARLSEVAKGAGGIAASGAALRRAGADEVSRWRVAESRCLRGRSSPTEIAYPITPYSSSAEPDC